MHHLNSDSAGTLLIIVALIGIFVFIFGLRWLSGKAGNAINRAIKPGQHRVGQAAVGSSHVITPSSVSAVSLLDQIYRALPYPESEKPPNAMQMAIYKTGGPNLPALAVSFGSRFHGDSWIVGLTAVDSVTYNVTHATMSDGLVVGARQLADLEQLVLDTVKRVDPAATIRSEASKANWK